MINKRWIVCKLCIDRRPKNIKTFRTTEKVIGWKIEDKEETWCNPLVEACKLDYMDADKKTVYDVCINCDYELEHKVLGEAQNNFKKF